jgi:tetratricopeptide (TPR) repeat protein
LKVFASKTTFILGFLILSFQACTFDINHHKIENWHKIRATGEAAMVKHDYVAAQKSFEEALKIVEPIHNEPVRLAVSLEELSRVCLETNDMQLTTNICNQAMSLANKRSQTPHKQLDVLENELGECLINIGRVYSKAKKYDQAAIAFREARALMVDVYKNSPPMLANFIAASYLAWSVDGLGTSYKELGQLKEARQAYFSVADYNVIKGLSQEYKQKLLTDFCLIPDTSKEDKEKYASTLGCSL